MLCYVILSLEGFCKNSVGLQCKELHFSCIQSLEMNRVEAKHLDFTGLSIFTVKMHNLNVYDFYSEYYYYLF